MNINAVGCSVPEVFSLVKGILLVNGSIFGGAPRDLLSYLIKQIDSETGDLMRADDRYQAQLYKDTSDGQMMMVLYKKTIPYSIISLWFYREEIVRLIQWLATELDCV